MDYKECELDCLAKHFIGWLYEEEFTGYEIDEIWEDYNTYGDLDKTIIHILFKCDVYSDNRINSIILEQLSKFFEQLYDVFEKTNFICLIDEQSIKADNIVSVSLLENNFLHG